MTYSIRNLRAYYYQAQILIIWSTIVQSIKAHKCHYLVHPNPKTSKDSISIRLQFKGWHKVSLKRNRFVWCQQLPIEGTQTIKYHQKKTKTWVSFLVTRVVQNRCFCKRLGLHCSRLKDLKLILWGILYQKIVSSNRKLF